MKCRGFRYCRVLTVEEAVESFVSCEGEARFLAGGQSLLPALNLRLSAPDLLIDISRVEGLRGITLEGSDLRIGALTRHVEVLHSPLVAEYAPLLARAARFVAHPAIRNLGTFGGSLALADPASEFPACVLALNAQIEIAGLSGRRRVAADDYFLGLYETALEPGEILTAVYIPAGRTWQRVCFNELSRRRGDYALAGLAAQATFGDGGEVLTALRLVFCALGSKPMRAQTAEAALLNTKVDAVAIKAAQHALSQDLSPDEAEDLSSAARLHLARVLLGRVAHALREGA